MKNIKTVGVIGAGTMGAALAQKFAQEGFKVILADRELKLVEKGLSRIKAMWSESAEKKIFSPEQIGRYTANTSGTADLAYLNRCDIIIEAIYEDFNAKRDLFKALSETVPADTIIATNTSSFSVSELAAFVKYPERFIGLHYFYHAAKNRLVEIVPGNETSAETKEAAFRFSVLSGKDPIFTSDAYGFAMNRFFVPWLNEAVKLLEEKIATSGMIDAVCMKTFGITMGPFALMNATGIPIALHSQRTLEYFGPAYKVSRMLVTQAEKGELWNPDTATESHWNEDIVNKINNRMLGCVFFICSQILNEKICTATDLNKGAKIGLKWKHGPVDMMLKAGEEAVRELVAGYAAGYHVVPPEISAQSWQLEFVTYEKSSDRAVITLNRPEDLNALNEDLLRQLDEKFILAENDPSVKSIFITGSGKAFVAGADIKYFISNIKSNSIEKIIDFTDHGQHIFDRIDNSSKKVVVILNGMALGGGLELALCGDQVLAVPDARLAFPETGIGIYPGLGGAKRSARRIGKGLAKYLIYTGKKITASHAVDIGLIDNVISKEDAMKLMSGEIKPESIPAGKKNVEERCRAIGEFFDSNSLDHLLHLEYSIDHLAKEDAERIIDKVRGRAPLALRISEKLINGFDRELSGMEDMKEIFSSKDAWLGLSSRGNKVIYTGT